MKTYLLTTVLIYFSFSASKLSAQVANRYDIVITEIFPDPSPSFGLPASEFIELRNVSAIAINLKDWTISNGNVTATISSTYILKPDSMFILCAVSAATHFASYGPVAGLSNFPSLDNDAGLVVLRSKEGSLIHALKYDNEWYHSSFKSNGGWTLEMIDPHNPCTGSSNWTASKDAAGGTPGKTNSTNAGNKDDTPPVLLRSYAIDSVTIVAVFRESTDSLSSANPLNFQVNAIPTNPISARPIGPLFNEVMLRFPTALSNKFVYDLTARNIMDCAGNIGTTEKVRAGLPAITTPSEIVINEILFNPTADGFDFVELYNASGKIFNLQDLYFANRTIVGGLSNIKQLSLEPILFFPGEHVVITENFQWLVQHYTVKNRDAILQLKSFPSLPDDKGILVLQNSQGTVIDELQYDSKWHFALIVDDEGISLERIDYTKPTQLKSNWTSAASTSGFATPGYQNSQFRADVQLQGLINITPKVFSPDNDGFDDFSTIEYQVPSPGYVANIYIFDVNGRQVRYLAKNATLSLRGNFRWDGLDDKQQRLPVGIYIILTEIFNLQGKTKKFKNAITLATPL